jgi:hypothetical protein
MGLAFIYAALVAFGLYRRPDWVTGGLAISFGLSAVLHWTQPTERLFGMLGGMDALVSIGMLLVWTYYRSQRARIVGTVSLFKCAWAFLMSANSIDWLFYAITLNAAFVFQVLVAGGMADGLVGWLDRIDPRAIRERGSRRENVG